MTIVLEVSLISNKLPYKALSYSWREGDTRTKSEATIFIKVGEDEDEDENDVRVRITSSLAQAIRRLRSSYHPVHLWIDSLCINQKDSDEKTQQVRLMGDIYCHASEVVIWLGERGERDELGEWLQGIRQRTVSYTDWHEDNRSAGLVDKYRAGYRQLSQTSDAALYPRNDVYVAFCLVLLLGRGHRPEDIEFARSSILDPSQWYKQVSDGLRTIMDRNWVSKSPCPVSLLRLG